MDYRAYTTPVTVDLATRNGYRRRRWLGAGSGTGNSGSSIENVDGGTGGNTITGDGDNNTFMVNSSDKYSGGGGNDHFIVTPAVARPQYSIWTGRESQGPDTPGLYDPSTSMFLPAQLELGRTGQRDVRLRPGQRGLEAIAGDWNGSGVTSVALFDPKTSIFYLRNSSTREPPMPASVSATPPTARAAVTWCWSAIGPATGWTRWASMTGKPPMVFEQQRHLGRRQRYQFCGYGQPGSDWIPVVGDWSGNGMDSVGLYDRGNCRFYLRNSNSYGRGHLYFRLRPAECHLDPVMGDWDGNSTVDDRFLPGRFRPMVFTQQQHRRRGRYQLRLRAPGISNLAADRGQLDRLWRARSEAAGDR